MGYFKIISLIFVGFLLGVLSHKYNPIHLNSIDFIKRYILQKKIKFEVVTYNHGDYIFLDRNYSESLHPKELENTFLVKTNRHANGTLFLKVKNEVILHRIISAKNNNQGYFDWVIKSSKARVSSLGDNLNILITKKFNKGFYRLKLGGPFSADPIFISTEDLDLTKHFSISS